MDGGASVGSHYCTSWFAGCGTVCNIISLLDETIANKQRIKSMHCLIINSPRCCYAASNIATLFNKAILSVALSKRGKHGIYVIRIATETVINFHRHRKKSHTSN